MPSGDGVGQAQNGDAFFITDGPQGIGEDGPQIAPSESAINSWARNEVSSRKRAKRERATKPRSTPVPEPSVSLQNRVESDRTAQNGVYLHASNPLRLRIRLSLSSYRKMAKSNEARNVCRYCAAPLPVHPLLIEDPLPVLKQHDSNTDGIVIALGEVSLDVSAVVNARKDVKPPKTTGDTPEGPFIEEGLPYECLAVERSGIHGMGLFARSQIPEGAFLMRYEGEIIGKCVSDKRERNYQRNSIGSIYMFKVDEDTIIDATMVGNRARYINHSCDPNCYSITDLPAKSILYYASRPIGPGEELTIDYHFTEDDPGDVCFCGSERCKSRGKAQ